jgi:hypothetical protein
LLLSIQDLIVPLSNIVVDSNHWQLVWAHNIYTCPSQQLTSNTALLSDNKLTYFKHLEMLILQYCTPTAPVTEWCWLVQSQRKTDSMWHPLPLYICIQYVAYASNSSFWDVTRGQANGHNLSFTWSHHPLLRRMHKKLFDISYDVASSSYLFFKIKRVWQIRLVLTIDHEDSSSYKIGGICHKLISLYCV